MSAVPSSVRYAEHVKLLIGREQEGFLGSAVDAAGGTLVSSRVKQVFQQRRNGAIATYHASVRWADQSVTTEVLVACTGDLPEGTAIIGSGVDRVAVWRFPHDPDLPGLVNARSEVAVARLLRELDLGDGPVRLKVRAYRPRRRAVIEANGAAGRLFVKAVPPQQVAQLHQRHRLLIAHGVPAPQSLGWTNDGLLVLQALPGPTLRQAIRAGDVPVPSGETIVQMLDRLPAALASGPARRSWLDRVESHAAVTATIMPAEGARLGAIAAAIKAEAGNGPIVAVHGDFYESQLLVNGSAISGLLDIDGAGAGDRLDDLGCLVGHLSVLASVDRKHAERINKIGADYLAAFERTVKPADLRYRVAAVVVSLIAGPHRVQDPKWPEATRRLIDLAESWLASARRADKTLN